MLGVTEEPPMEPPYDEPPEEPGMPLAGADEPPEEPEPDPLIDAKPNVVPFPLGGPAFEPPDADPSRAAEAPRVVEPEQALVLQRDTLLERANAMQVVDAASYRIACDFMLTLSAWIKEAEDYWNPRVAAAHKVWEQLCNDRSAFTAPLKLAKGTLSQSADGWKRTEEQRLKREADERQAQLDRDAEAERARIKAEAQAAAAAGDAEKAADLFQEARHVEAPLVKPEPAAPEVKGVNHRERWVAEVVDEDKLYAAVANGQLSRQALLVNETYLGSRARTDKGSIAEEWKKYGIRVYDAGSIAVSSRGRR